MTMGDRELLDAKAAGRWERVRAELAARPALFARRGAVVATWRSYGGRRLGPYFQLAFREGARQRSIYLGRCRKLARRVRELLARLQRPRRERRRFARLTAQVRASLGRWKARLREELAQWGVQLKGFEFRGAGRVFGGLGHPFPVPVHRVRGPPVKERHCAMSRFSR